MASLLACVVTAVLAAAQPPAAPAAVGGAPAAAATAPAAQAGTPPPAPTTTSPPATSSSPPATSEVATAPPDTRPPPDVAAGERSDGRLDPRPPRHWRLVPEILLFPLRALFWAIQWPVGAALRLEDRDHPFKRLVNGLTWSGGTRGLRPAFYYSTIYVPEFGLKYFDHLSLGVDTRLDLTTTVGGAHYVYTDLLVEPTRTTGPIGVVFDLTFDRRGDLLWNGLGNHTYSDAPNGRYLMNALISNLVLRVRPWYGLQFFANVGTGLKRFDNGDRVGGDPGVSFVFDTTTIPGFTHGTTYVRTGLGFELDTRATPLHGASGLVLRGAFDYSHGIDGDTSEYERLAGMLGVPINLWSGTRVLWLQAATMLTWQNGDTPVPFSELPTLGGPNDLRGFRFQDFRDFTSFYVTAEYRWPVWMWVDGALFFDYGGVFGENYAGFGARRMQPDLGVALRVVTSNHFFVRAQLGYGFGEGVNFSLTGNVP